MLAAPEILIDNKACFNNNVKYWNRKGMIDFKASIKNGIATYDTSLKMETSRWCYLGGITILGTGVALTVNIGSKICLLLMAVVSAMAGTIACVVMKKPLLYFNPQLISSIALRISCVTALVLLGVMYLILYALLNQWMTFYYTETFLFWFLFPALIFLVSIIGGSKLNRILGEEI